MFASVLNATVSCGVKFSFIVPAVVSAVVCICGFMFMLYVVERVPVSASIASTSAFVFVLSICSVKFSVSVSWSMFCFSVVVRVFVHFPVDSISPIFLTYKIKIQKSSIIF